MSTSVEHREVLQDHDRHPRHHGLQACFDVEARADNPVCGDRVVLRLGLDGARVRQVSFESAGCSISRAAASVMTDLVVGSTLTEALRARDRFAGMLRGGRVEHGGGSGDGRAEEGGGGGADDAWRDAEAFAGAGRYPSRVRCVLLGWSALADACARA